MYILIFLTIALAGYSGVQIKLFGLNVKDFWSFIEANQILDKLYELSYVPESITAITLETKLSRMIYNIYVRNFGKDPNRVESFKQQAGENKLTALSLSRKKTTLVRNNTFNRIKTSVQNSLQKVKKLFKVNTPKPQHAYSR